MKRQFLILVAAAFLGGALMQGVLSTLDAARAGEPVDGEKVISGTSFVLTSKDGKMRAKLAFDAKGTPNLWLADQQGKWYPQLKDIDEYAIAQALLKALRDDIKALEARPEHKADSVTLAHILISFSGARRSQETRTQAQAEALTARILAKIKAGADFNKLMKEFSGDPGGGTYPVELAKRDKMVPAFGNVGWRLKVNEVGVAPFDSKKSPFGFHIIKRIK